MTAGIGGNKQIKVRTNYRHNSWSQSSILKQVLACVNSVPQLQLLWYSSQKKKTSLVFIVMLELTCYLELLEVSWMKK